MKPKYKRGKHIKSIGDFANSKSLWFRVSFGNKERTTHRSFVESWQYHTLEMFIKSGRIYEADPIDSDKITKENNSYNPIDARTVNTWDADISNPIA